MGAKEFSKELMDLTERAVKDGILKGHLSFAQMIGTLEMAKMDIHNYAMAFIREQEQKEQSLILVPKPDTSRLAPRP